MRNSLAEEDALYINLIKNETDNIGIAIADFLILGHHLRWPCLVSKKFRKSTL